MRLARKLFLLAAMALAALALTATTANAQFPVEVAEEHLNPDEDGHCPAVMKEVHVVTGGCHFEVETEHHIPLVAQTAGGPVTLSNCDVHLEARIDENGNGWVTRMKLTPEPDPPVPTCTRAACDEANTAMSQIPWPIAITENSGAITATSTFCLRTITSGEGGLGTQCTVQLPIFDNENHQYEIGNESNYTCTNLPQVSIHEVHFVNEIQDEPNATKEDLEIIH